VSIPPKFNGMTDEQIVSYLETSGNVSGLTDVEIAWMLSNKQGVLATINYDTLEAFNSLLSSVNLSRVLTPAKMLVIVNDPLLTSIEKVKQVDSSTLNMSGEPIKETNVLKLNLSAFIGTSMAANASDLVNSVNSFSELLGVVSVLELVSTTIPQVPSIVNSFSQTANTLFADFYKGLESLVSGTFSVTDISKSIDPGYGFQGVVGGTGNSGQYIAYGGLETPANQQTDSSLKYIELENVLTRTLRQDWKTRNAKPGNPLILEAYALSGRNYDRDGTTGEFVWAAPYVNWVLNKSGLPYLKTISPSAYSSYGNPVDFGNFKNVRKNDIVIFKSSFGIAHIGFIQSYDPKTDTLRVLGGNQAGTVKITKFSGLKITPELYISHIRRNWTLPADKDVPLFDISLPTRPGQQTSGPSTVRLPTRPGQAGSGPAYRIDYSAGGAGALGGTTV